MSAALLIDAMARSGGRHSGNTDVKSTKGCRFCGTEKSVEDDYPTRATCKSCYIEKKLAYYYHTYQSHRRTQDQKIGELHTRLVRRLLFLLSKASVMRSLVAGRWQHKQPNDDDRRACCQGASLMCIKSCMRLQIRRKGVERHL